MRLWPQVNNRQHASNPYHSQSIRFSLSLSLSLSLSHENVFIMFRNPLRQRGIFWTIFHLCYFGRRHDHRVADRRGPHVALRVERGVPKTIKAYKRV